MPRLAIRDQKSSLSFNGTSSGVTVPVVPATTGFSFGLWFKMTKAATNDRILDYADSGPTGGFNVVITATGIVEIAIRDGAVTTAALGPIKTTPRNEWVHLVGTYVPDNARMYVNAVWQATDGLCQMSAPTQTLTIGKRSPTSANYFGGNISQFVFQNTTTPWTQEQVTALYNGTIPSGATCVLPLQEGAGTTAYDSSGNNNNGTITNGTWVRDTPTKKRKTVNDNLVYNGDFSIAPPVNVPQTTAYRWLDGTANGIIVSGVKNSTNRVPGIYYWDKVGTGSIMIDTTEKFNGKNSLKVSTLATGSTVLASIGDFNMDDYIIVAPNTSYTFSYWMKTNYTSGDTNAGAVAFFIEMDGSRVAVQTNFSSYVKTSTDWTRYTGTFTTKSVTRYVRCNFVNNGNTGAATLIMDAWFSQIELRPTVPETRLIATGRTLAGTRLTA